MDRNIHSSYSQKFLTVYLLPELLKKNRQMSRITTSKRNVQTIILTKYSDSGEETGRINDSKTANDNLTAGTLECVASKMTNENKTKCC